MYREQVGRGICDAAVTVTTVVPLRPERSTTPGPDLVAVRQALKPP